MFMSELYKILHRGVLRSVFAVMVVERHGRFCRFFGVFFVKNFSGKARILFCPPLRFLSCFRRFFLGPRIYP